MRRFTRHQRGMFTVVAALAVASTATGSAVADSTGRTSAVESGAVEGTLTMWRLAGEADWWAGFADRFAEAHPGAEIDVTSYTSAEYWTKLIAAFGAGEGPDIHTNANGEQVWNFSRSGHLAALDDLVNLSYWSPASVDLFTAADGSTYAVPLYTFLVPVWYNATLFEENGLTAPTTWDELVGACETLSEAGIIPIALGNGGADQWTAQFFLESLMYQYGGRSIHIDATFGNNGTIWSDPAIVSAATRLNELVDANCFPRGFTGLNYDQMTAMFVSGDAAMIHMGNWIVPEVEESGIDAEVFAFPDVPDAVHSTADLEGMLGGAEGVMVSAAAAEENPALVSAFLDDLGKDLDRYAADNGALSVAADPQPAGGAYQERFTELLGSVGEYMSATNQVVPSSIHAAFFQNLQDLTAGRLSPEEFGEAMVDIVEQERDTFPDES